MSGLRAQLTVALLGMMALPAGCWKKNEYAPPPPPKVEVARPTRQPVRDYLEFAGTTRAVTKVELRARVNGYLRSIHFDDGATVEKGNLLFIIEQAPFQAKAEVARAELRKAEASLRLAEIELARSRALVQRHAVSTQELDTKVAEHDSAAAVADAARAALRDAELQLGYTEIRAPIGGRIGRHLVDVGNLVMPEQTHLATIECYDPIYAYFTMSESDLLYLNRLSREDGKPPLDDQGLSLEMGLGDERGYPHTGKLDFGELGVDPDTGTVMYRAVFPNSNLLIVPGLFARLRTAIAEPKPRLVVPERALGTDQRGDYVLVVGEDHIVEYRPVRLGRAVDGLRVIENGLSGAEWVVVNGVQHARSGAKVETNRAGAVAFRPSNRKPIGTPSAQDDPAGPLPISRRRPAREG